MHKSIPLSFVRYLQLWQCGILHLEKPLLSHTCPSMSGSSAICSNFANGSCLAVPRELPREAPRDVALDGGGISRPVSAEYWQVRGLPVPVLAWYWSCGWFPAGGATPRAIVKAFSSSLQPSVTGTVKQENKKCNCHIVLFDSFVGCLSINSNIKRVVIETTGVCDVVRDVTSFVIHPRKSTLCTAYLVLIM